MAVSGKRTSSIMDNEPNKPHDNAAAEAAAHHEGRSSPRRTTKMVLGGLSIAIAAALLGIGISAFWAPIGFRILAGLATAMGAAVLIYYVVEAVVVCGQRTKAGLRPPVALSLHLVLCLGGIVIASLLVASTAYVVEYRPAFDGDQDGELVPVPGYVTDGYYWYNMSLAGCALTFASALIHIVLSTLAAIDVHRERKAKSRPASSVEEADGAAAPAYSPHPFTPDDVQELSSSSSSSSGGGSSAKPVVEVTPPQEMAGNTRAMGYSSHAPEPKSRGA